MADGTNSIEKNEHTRHDGRSPTEGMPCVTFIRWTTMGAVSKRWRQASRQFAVSPSNSMRSGRRTEKDKEKDEKRERLTSNASPMHARVIRASR
ncbi:hypothetical protein WN51_00239 [Melipona quadrifasciata]|uniref:Uncharacterized protein n=1 Tax=Melipona quadrifasciata TaxID=166423 RepID=A0A0M9A1A0_9HYME|nr:hypothetical protein WN51_00239 [Melipona quadrifasciata]